MAKTIEQEKQEHVQRMLSVLQDSQAEEVVRIRDIVNTLPLGQQYQLLTAFAQFTVSNIYYDQVLQGPVPGAALPCVVVTEQGQQLLEAMELPPYVSTTEVAMAFVQIKAVFKNRLSPEDWEIFEHHLRAFEMVFNDANVLHHLRATCVRKGTPTARYLGLMQRLQVGGFLNLPDLDRLLRTMPVQVLERFVLFLEDWENRRFNGQPYDEDQPLITQLQQQAWWRQLLEFLDARPSTQPTQQAQQ